MRKITMQHYDTEHKKVYFLDERTIPQSVGLQTSEPKQAIINLLATLFEVDLHKANALPSISIEILPNECYKLEIDTKTYEAHSLKECLERVLSAFISHSQ